MDPTHKSKINTFLSLFTPSGMGLVLYVFFSGLFVFLHQVPIIEQYLQIPKGFNVIHIVGGWLESFLNGTVGQSKTETLVVGLFWAVVGLGVYLFLQGIGRFINEFTEGIEERNSYMWPKGVDRNSGVREAVRRVMFQGLAFIALVIVVFGPMVHVLRGPLWTTFLGPNMPLRLGVWFVVLCLMLHVCVILLRLSLLKPRIFD